jgi:hypothetical protein
MVDVGFLGQQRCEIAPMLREPGFRALSERTANPPTFGAVPSSSWPGLSSKSILPRAMLCFLNFALRFFRYWMTFPTGVLSPGLLRCFIRKPFSTAKSWSLPSLSCKQSRCFTVFPSRLGHIGVSRKGARVGSLLGHKTDPDLNFSCRVLPVG